MNATVDKQIITLSENYEVNGETKTAKVKLMIDYNAKQFTINPGDRMHAFEFGRYKSDSGKLWETIGTLINMAAHLGQRRLEEDAKPEVESPKTEENVERED